MRAVIQRVTEASVRVGGDVIGTIARGYLVLLGVADGDNDTDVAFIVRKLLNLRLFADEKSHFSADITEIAGQVLVVSQFTLYADLSKGRRPSFSAAARPEPADAMYQRVVAELRTNGLTVATGIFGADMQVSLVNDGPVTIIVDSQNGGGFQ